MGGYGSTRWNSHYKKTAVEDCRKLSVKVIHSFIPNSGRWGTLSWHRGSKPLGNISYQVIGFEDPESIRLIYTITKHDTQAKKDFDYPIRLTKTPLPWGGHRLWFICPNICCGRRVSVLYLPPRGEAGGKLCHEPLVKGNLIECVTWDYIMDLITNPEQFEQKLREAQAMEGEAIQPKQKELDHIFALLDRTEIEADEIAREIRKTKGIVRAKLEQQGDEVNNRYQALNKRKAELEDALAVELTDRNIDNLLEFREAVAVGLGNPTFGDKRRWLEILQTRVSVTGGIAVITCRLGGKPFAYNLSESFTSED